MKLVEEAALSGGLITPNQINALCITRSVELVRVLQGIDVVPTDTKLPADFFRGQLTFLDHPTDGDLGDVQIDGNLADRSERWFDRTSHGGAPWLATGLLMRTRGAAWRSQQVGLPWRGPDLAFGNQTRQQNRF